MDSSQYGQLPANLFTSFNAFLSAVKIVSFDTTVSSSSSCTSSGHLPVCFKLVVQPKHAKCPQCTWVGDDSSLWQSTHCKESVKNKSMHDGLISVLLVGCTVIKMMRTYTLNRAKFHFVSIEISVRVDLNKPDILFSTDWA